MDCTKIIYWNALNKASLPAQKAYLTNVLEQYRPDMVCVTECTEALALFLHDRFGHHHYEPSIKVRNRWEGLAVSARTPFKAESTREWQAIGSEEQSRYDTRKRVRAELMCGTARLAVFAAHISHPHDLQYPQFALRRPSEWKSHKKALDTEAGPYVWLADTNTFLASTVAFKLGVKREQVLTHDGGRTWGFKPLSRKLLYIDRAVVSKDLVDEAALMTVASEINGVACPSDHVPICLSVQL